MPLLEREGELRRLTAVLDQAVAGRGGLALVRGPAGVGKTSLLQALRAQASDSDAKDRFATGAELETAFAFGVCHQLLDSEVEGLSPEDRDEVFSGAAGHARGLFEGGPAGVPAPTSDPFFRVLHGLYWLTANLAERSALVLILDDVQWADIPSLRFLDYLARRVGEMPVSLVLALRSGDPDTGHELLVSLRSQPSAIDLSLEPLSEPAVASFVREEIADAPDSLCRACAEATGGNPFYLRELLSDVAPRAAADETAPASLAGIEVGSIARSVIARIGRLGDEAAELASATAILGDGAPVRRAAKLAGLEPAAAARATDLLAEGEILQVENEQLEFVHPIVRQSVYGDLPAARRAEKHAQAAQMLDAEEAAGDVVASQLLLGSRRGEEWAVAALRRAAADANQSGAPEVAVRYLRRALEEPPAAGDRPQVLLEAGLAEMLSGDPSAVEHLREALDRAGQPGLRAGAASALAATLAFHARTPEAAQVLRDVLDDVAEAEPLMATLISAELTLMGVLDLRSRELAAGELAATRAEEERLIAEANGPLLAVLGAEALATGTASRAAERAERALEAGQLLTVLPPEHPAAFMAIATLIATDRGPAAERYLARAAENAAASGSVRAFGAVAVLRSRATFRWGRIAEAEAEARTAIPLIIEHSWHAGAALVVASLVDPLIERGELTEAQRTLELIDPEREDTGAQGFQQWRDARARLLLEVGRPDGALEELLACGRWERAWGNSNSIFIHYPWRSTAALAQLAMGNPADARALALEAVEIAEPFGDPHTTGIAHRIAGVVHDGRRRLAHLRTAAETLEGSCSRLEYAKALVDLGMALRLSKRRREAREPLSSALDIAHRCGGTVVEKRAREELLATGARPRSPSLSGIDSLTPSEKRVAALGAEGLSNPEIAQALFVTRKTVEMHLSNAYRKLEVAGREELAGALSGGTPEATGRSPAG